MTMKFLNEMPDVLSAGAWDGV